MPSFETHYIYDCLVFGVENANTFSFLHRVIDGVPKHRRRTHNLAFVNFIRFLYGDMAALILLHHIALDLYYTNLKREKRKEKKQLKKEFFQNRKFDLLQY